MPVGRPPKKKNMIVLLSPAKSLDFSPIEYDHFSQPRLLKKSEELIGNLRKKTSKKNSGINGCQPKHC